MKSSNSKSLSFSFILPTYNRAHRLAKAVDSVLRQAYPHFELLIVDDGSSDNTRELIEHQYAHELEAGKIRYIALPENRGVCAARNEGLRAANNPWIAYVDSDNHITEHFLDVFRQAIQSHPRKKTFYADMRYDCSQQILSCDFDFKRLLRGNFIDQGVFVHHHSLYHKLGGYDTQLKRLVDWDLIIRYTENHPPHHCCEVVLLYDDSEGEQRISTTENEQEANRKVLAKHAHKRRWYARLWRWVRNSFS